MKLTNYRNAATSVFEMTPREKGRMWLGLSGVFFSLAVASYLSPPSEPATGRWAWLHNLFLQQFGPSGDLILYLVLGGASLLAASWQFFSGSGR